MVFNAGHTGCFYPVTDRAGLVSQAGEGVSMNHHDYDHLIDQHTGTQEALEPIDWGTVMEITPALVSVTCWLIWGLFLLFPSLFGLHGTHVFSAANNAVFVMMGFIFCIAVSSAIRAGHGGRSVLFALSVALLSF